MPRLVMRQHAVKSPFLQLAESIHGIFRELARIARESIGKDGVNRWILARVLPASTAHNRCTLERFFVSRPAQMI
jgi:hypothetical protein